MNIILSNGTIKTIGRPPFELPTTILSKRRVSTITPVFFPQKQAFRFLRWVFGEEGRVARFTRTWSGPWIVKILATGEWSVFFKRQAAIDWELEQLYGDIDKWL